MKYYDLHVRFPFNDYREAGFSRVAVWGKDIREFDDNASQKGLLLLDSGDISYIRPRIKRCDMVHNASYRLDPLVLRAAARHDKPFEIAIRPILLSSGAKRSLEMRRASRFLKFCNKFGAGYVLTSRARGIFETKRPEELISIGCALGLSYDQALMAVTGTPERVMGV